MSNPKWQIGPVKLRSGETALIDAINPGQKDYRYTGRFDLYGTWTPIGWDSNGVVMHSYADSPSSLAPLWLSELGPDHHDNFDHFDEVEVP